MLRTTPRLGHDGGPGLPRVTARGAERGAPGRTCPCCATSSRRGPARGGWWGLEAARRYARAGARGVPPLPRLGRAGRRARRSSRHADVDRAVPNRLHSRREIEEALVHELVHAYDMGPARRDLTDCDELASGCAPRGRNARAWATPRCPCDARERLAHAAVLPRHGDDGGARVPRRGRRGGRARLRARVRRPRASRSAPGERGTSRDIITKPPDADAHMRLHRICMHSATAGEPRLPQARLLEATVSPGRTLRARPARPTAGCARRCFAGLGRKREKEKGGEETSARGRVSLRGGAFMYAFASASTFSPSCRARP